MDASNPDKDDRKLPDKKKINWSAHLPEVVQAYNGTQSAITANSPHHLMFRCRPIFPIDLYFPSMRGESGKFCINYYTADIQKCLEQALEVAHEHNKDSFVGQRKIKDKWSNDTFEVVH